MTSRRRLLPFVLASTAACATAPKPGESFAAVQPGIASPMWDYRSLADAATFDHGCPRERIRVVREARDGADLDVCGAVRRYKHFGGGAHVPGTWLDVTSLYPASALPAPLPPAR